MGHSQGCPISVQGSQVRKGHACAVKGGGVMWSLFQAGGGAPAGVKGWGVMWSLFRREGRACGVKGWGVMWSLFRREGARLRGEGVGRDVEPI